MPRSASAHSYRTYNASSDALSDLGYEESEAPSSPSKSPRKRLASHQRLSQPEVQYAEDEDPGIPSFDAYFNANAHPSKTSTNVFTQLVQPLTSDEFASALPAPFDYLSNAPSYGLPEKLKEGYSSEYGRWERELVAGFNLLFYGFGSKRNALNEFVERKLRRMGHVVILNAFNPHFAIKDIYPALERLIPSEEEGTTLERAVRYFDTRPPPSERKKGKGKSRDKPLYLVIHNVDAPPLRTSKARTTLDTLLSARYIHCVASIDHINAPLLFSSSSLFSSLSPSSPSSSTPTTSTSSSTRKAWLWHDLTTLSPYSAELAFADPGSLRAARTTTDPIPGGAGAGRSEMTESAAQHVLLSVTSKAKKLFAIIASSQLAAESDASDKEEGKEKGIAYDRLFSLARDNFVATSDGALRALLGEFRDHGLVVTASTGAMGAGEMLWIPIRKERLGRLGEWLKDEGGS